MSGLKYGSGKNKFIGSGLTIVKDNLDPTLYSGSVIYADDQLLYYSNGSEWVQLQPPIIRRPVPIDAVTARERRLLRISPFVPGTGYESKIEWLKTTFYISYNKDMSNAFIVDVTDTNSQSTLSIDRPPNTYGLQLGQTFYWQAQYYGKFKSDQPNAGTLTEPSEKSKIQTQVFPDNLIETPTSVTLNYAETDRVVLSDYSSPFDLSNSGGSTIFQFYNIDDIPDQDAPIYTATSGNSSVSVLNISQLNGNLNYLWRGRYSVPSIGTSFPSAPSAFSPPYANLVLYIDTTKVAPFNAGKKTLYLYFLNTSNSTITWGDGTSNTITSSSPAYSVASHDYPVDGTYRVELGGGTVTNFGDLGATFDNPVQSNSQSMIINCTSFGTSLGIVNLQSAFRNAKNLTDVTAYLPSTVSVLRGTFLNCTNFNTPSISQWDVSRVSDFGVMFQGCSIFNVDLSKWNTRSASSMEYMFYNAPNFNSNISYWDTTNLRFMRYMFYGCSSFNRDLDKWNVSQIADLTQTFMNAGIFNGNVSTWNTSNIITMQQTFSGANNFNCNISSWNTSSVTNMSYMFQNAKSFNQDINNWNTNNVTTMAYMFNGASKFNQNLNLWNTNKVTSMAYMFNGASSFNANIYTWNTANVTTMTSMFNGATKFNQNLDSWNTSNVNAMSYMFYQASSFNGNVSYWNTSKVTDMTYVFGYANSYNQPIAWNTGNTTSMYAMFLNATAFNSNLYFTDTSKVTSMQQMFQSATAFTGNGNISAWNTSNVTNISYMFNAASAFNQNLDSWNTSKVTILLGTFQNAKAFNGNVSTWNTANVTNMALMFNGALVFNQNVNSWNTSKVTDMYFMFQGAYTFNQNLDSWNTANVTTMQQMFYNATAFNGNVSTWNTSKVTNMYAMFSSSSLTGAPGQIAPRSFNLDLSKWNTSNVVDMRFMFRYNTSFSGNVSSWDTSKATSFFQTFMNANAFNSNVSSWNTSNVKDMSYMFFGANTFNQNLSSWNVSNVATFEAMFYFARSFNQDLSPWTINKNATLNFTRFANTSGMSNTNFTRLLISFANQAKAAGDNPKAATFGLMSDRFYKPAYSTNNFGTAIQTGADAKTYLFDAGSPVAWINFDARIDSTP